MTSINNLTNAKLSSLKRDKIAGEKTITDKTGLKIKIRGRKDKDNSIKFFFRHVKNNKDTFQNIGEFPTVKIEEAREIYFKLKGQLERGLTVAVETQKDNNCYTLKDLWLDFYSLKKPTLKEQTYLKYEKYHRKYIKPFENMLISDITTDFLFKEIVKPLQQNKHYESIRYITTLYKRLLEFACFQNKIDKNPLVDVSKFIPKGKVTHYPTFALETLKEDLTKLFNVFSKADPTFQCLLHGYFYTLLRNTELRTLKWDEVKDGYFIVQTKVHADFKVPIVPQLQHIFDYLKKHRTSLNNFSPFVFSTKYGGCYSDNTITKALKENGYKDKFTVHGTRSCARQWMQVQSEIKESVAELCLCHVVGNSVMQAYNRGTYFEERIKAMQLWANFVDECIGNNGNFYKNVS